MLFKEDKSINGVLHKKGTNTQHFSETQIEAMKKRGWLEDPTQPNKTKHKAQEGK